MGGRPSQVSEGSIHVSYTEDLREGYLGYSVANVSWSRPEGDNNNQEHNMMKGKSITWLIIACVADPTLFGKS